MFVSVLLCAELLMLTKKHYCTDWACQSVRKPRQWRFSSYISKSILWRCNL